MTLPLSPPPCLALQLHIPLFLKASLGRNACGLKWGGNPRIVDSRHNFTSIFGCTQRAGPENKAPSAEPEDLQERHAGRGSVSACRPTSFTLVVPNRRPSYRSEGSINVGYNRMSAGLCLDPETTGGNGNPTSPERENENSGEFGRKGGIGAMGEGNCELGDDRGSVAGPWANGEDVCYFLLKVIGGNALVLIDFVIAVR